MSWITVRGLVLGTLLNQEINPHLAKSGKSSTSFLKVVPGGAPLEISNLFTRPFCSNSVRCERRGIVFWS